MKQFLRILPLISIFIAGVVCFVVFSFRFGFHPESWRVQAATHTLERIIDGCYSGNDNARTSFMVCVQKQLVASVKRWGVKPYMSALEMRLRNPEYAQHATQCHDVAHAIGWAGAVGNRDIQTLLPQCTDTCVYGCQHGAVSALIAMGYDIVPTLPTICTDIDWSASSKGIGGCFHEVGHAVSSIAGSDIHKAFSYCDQVNPVGRTDCGSGVFMEMFEAATFKDAPQALPVNHPEWCGELSDPYKTTCYNQAGANEYGRHQDDDRAFAVCSQVPDTHKTGCIRGLGQNIFYVYQHASNHANAVFSFCLKANEWFGNCMEGALASSMAVDPSGALSNAFCNATIEEKRVSCFEMVHTLRK
jgi:hypothetical protein